MNDQYPPLLPQDQHRSGGPCLQAPPAFSLLRRLAAASQAAPSRQHGGSPATRTSVPNVIILDPGVLESAVEAPRKPGVRFNHVTTISLGGGKGTIAHLVNEAGAAARAGAVRQTLLRYPLP